MRCVRVCVCRGEGSACVWFLRLLWSGLLPRLVEEDVAALAGCRLVALGDAKELLNCVGLHMLQGRGEGEG